MATFYASTVNKNKEATHQQVSELARLNEYFKAEDLCQTVHTTQTHQD